MKHKWLEEIGDTSYPDNHFGGCHSIKEWLLNIKYKLKKRKTGVDPRDCWSLDYWYYEWLYEHLMQFLSDARYLDLEYNKFTYNDKECTLLELIHLLCEKLRQMIMWDEFDGVPDVEYELIEGENGYHTYKLKTSEDDNEKFIQAVRKNEKEKEELKTEIFDIWKLIIDALWW